MSKYSSGSDRHRDRDSSSRSHHRSRHRSPSPGPSRGRSSPRPPRDEKVLPKTFGRREETEREIDDLNILQRMKTSFENSPLQSLYTYMKSNQKVKIWTRNFKEVRGVMTGYVVAFDKHWNLILRDVDEVYLKHKKSKTPFLREVGTNENLPDIPVKVPRKKKTSEEKAAAEAEKAAKAAATPKPSESESESAEKSEKKKKRKKKKSKNTTERRHVDQLFIRGDNVVMITPLPDEEEEESEVTQGETEEGEHEPGSA